MPRCELNTNLPNAVGEFAGWTDDPYLDLACAVICSGKDEVSPVITNWLDGYLDTSGSAAKLIEAWQSRITKKKQRAFARAEGSEEVSTMTRKGRPLNERRRANRLRELRSEKGLRQAQLAQEARTSAAIISTIEKHDEYPMPDLRTRLAKALGVTEVEIWPRILDITFSEQEQPNQGETN